jgi:hypothetical protein
MLPTLFAAIPQGVEPAIVWWGQSNAEPQGLISELIAESPELALGLGGVDVTSSTTTADPVPDEQTIVVTSPTLLTNEWAGAEYRFGTPLSPNVGYGIVLGNAPGAMVVRWIKKPPVSTALATGYLCFRDHRRSKYGNVRVLTPYQPELIGGYPVGETVTLPGFAKQDTITTFEELAAFLPFSFNEGLVGYGVSNSHLGGAATAADATTFDFTTTIGAGVMAGGYLRVQHTGGVSWSQIGDNGTTDFTGLSWQGAGTPTGTAATWLWEAWLPHYLNSPAELLPGKGFRYPNKGQLPRAPIFNLATNNVAFAYNALGGAMLATAWRLSAKLGRRVSVIPLAAGATTLLPAMKVAFPVLPVGWWDNTVARDWNPSGAKNLATRMRTLLRVAQDAHRASGETTQLRVYAIAGMQGESDTNTAAGRALYRKHLRMFYDWIAEQVHVNGISAYPSPDMMPVVHPLITTAPWNAQDAAQEVRSAIEKFALTRPYTLTFETNQNPKGGATGSDQAHFNGVGEARNGKQIAEALFTLIAAAITQQDDSDSPEVLSICNTALRAVGDGGMVTSLDPAKDATVQATLCRDHYGPERDALLQRCRWSFATQTSALEPSPDPAPEGWAYAYVYPEHAHRVFDVGPSKAIGALPDASALEPFANVVPGHLATDSRPFGIATDHEGNRVVVSNVGNASATYTVRVTSPSIFPPKFRRALIYRLAAKFAAPLIKGMEGMRVAEAMDQKALFEEMGASASDATQSVPPTTRVAPWLRRR